MLRPLWHLSKSGSHLPTETGIPWLYLLADYIQRDGSQVLGDRYFSVTEDTSQGDAERVYNCKFSEVNTLRKVRSGA